MDRAQKRHESTELTDEAHINFLMATPKVCSATEAERVQPEAIAPPAHDVFTRLLHWLEFDAVATTPQVKQQGCVLVVDDSTLDIQDVRRKN